MKISMPTESWAAKFGAFRDWLKTEDNIDLRIYLSPSVAIRQVEGWKARPEAPRGCMSENIPALAALKILCGVHGFIFERTQYGILIDIDPEYDPDSSKYRDPARHNGSMRTTP